MNILDNELVLKYFGGHQNSIPNTPHGVAMEFINAMQQPIRKGELMLFVPGNHNPSLCKSEEYLADCEAVNDLRDLVRLAREIK